MFLHLLAQTWRSIVAVFISWGIILWSIIYNPDVLYFIIRNARSTREWLIDRVESRASFENTTVDILASTMITDHTVTMAMLFLFSRVVVLTLILFAFGSIWQMISGRTPAFAR